MPVHVSKSENYAIYLNRPFPLGQRQKISTPSAPLFSPPYHHITHIPPQSTHSLPMFPPILALTNPLLLPTNSSRTIQPSHQSRRPGLVCRPDPRRHPGQPDRGLHRREDGPMLPQSKSHPRSGRQQHRQGGEGWCKSSPCLLA